MGTRKPVAACFLLLLAVLLVFKGSEFGLVGVAAQAEAEIAEVEAALVEGPSPSDAVEQEEPASENEEAREDEDGSYQESAEHAGDRPVEERPRTTKRLYTTRRTNHAGGRQASQQALKLKLLGLGMVLLVALVAVALKGKGFWGEDDDDDGEGEGEGERAKEEASSS